LEKYHKNNTKILEYSKRGLVTLLYPSICLGKTSENKANNNIPERIAINVSIINEFLDLYFSKLLKKREVFFEINGVTNNNKMVHVIRILFAVIILDSVARIPFCCHIDAYSPPKIQSYQPTEQLI